MAMNDEETVALIAGGHTFGKTHGAAPDSNVEDNPEAAGLEQQGLGWKNNHGTGKGDDTITSGLEVTWTYHPTRWDNEFFHILYAYEWELMRSPGGGHQWRPVNGGGADMVPLAHSTAAASPACSRATSRCAPTRRTTRSRAGSPRIPRVRRRVRAGLVQAHAPRHGPDRPLPRPEVPTEELLWQDPVPAVDHELIDAADAAALKAQVLDSGLTVASSSPRPGRRHPRSAAATSAAASTAPASASPRRRTGR